MNLKWLRSAKAKLYMETGLAVLLAVLLGVAGNLVVERAENSEIYTKAATENESARQKQQSESKNPGNTSTDTTDAKTQTVGADGQYPIMGSSDVTVEQMVSYYKASGEEYPEETLSKGGADSIETFCQMYYEEAAAEGVRAEVAFVQAMKETAWLQYGGDAKIEQYNFAGIGTTGGGVPGNSYADVRTGIRAQIQHLKAYATEDVLAQECVDERYEYVKKGSAPYVEWLGQKENPQGAGWATDENYGYSIVEMINKLRQM